MCVLPWIVAAAIAVSDFPLAVGPTMTIGKRMPEVAGAVTDVDTMMSS